MLRSVLVVVGLVAIGLAAPVTAQDVAPTGLAQTSSLVKTDSIAAKSSAPLRAAIAREGARLARQPPAQMPEATPWSSVQSLKSGVEIVITRRDASPERRVAVSADEQTITVLNLTDPALPVEVVRALRVTASRQVDVISRRRGRLWMRGVRIQQGAIFFRDQQIADVSQLLETLRRDDVVLVALGERERTYPRSVLWTSMIGGAAGGGLVLCSAWEGAECMNDGAFAVGAGIGAVVGAIVGRRLVGRPVDGDIVVYREPAVRRD